MKIELEDAVEFFRKLEGPQKWIAWGIMGAFCAFVGLAVVNRFVDAKWPNPIITVSGIPEEGQLEDKVTLTVEVDHHDRVELWYVGTTRKGWQNPHKLLVDSDETRASVEWNEHFWIPWPRTRTYVVETTIEEMISPGPDEPKKKKKHPSDVAKGHVVVEGWFAGAGVGRSSRKSGRVWAVEMEHSEEFSIRLR